MAFELTSLACTPGGRIAKKYTADGADVSPPLEWTDPPSGTKSFAIICDDPDAPAGNWVHWVLWGLPESARSLDENVSKQETLPSGVRQGVNNFKKVGYGGPAPPRGPAHRYFFRLYALDSVPDLKPGSNKFDLERAMRGHIVGQCELMGKYGR